MRKLLIALLLLFTTNAYAVDITFYQGDGNTPTSDTVDAYLNFGQGRAAAATSLRIGGINSNEISKTVVRFPNFIGVSGIPAGSKITSASLILYREGEGTYNTSTSNTVGAYRILQDWDSSGSGYYGRPGWYYRLTSTQWTNVGLLSPSSSYSATSDTVTLSSGFSQTYSWDITDDIQNWVSGVNSNYGHVLYGENTVGLTKAFSSSTNATATNRPTLSVSYTAIDEEDVTAPTLTAPTSDSVEAGTTVDTVTFTTDEDCLCKVDDTADIVFITMDTVTTNPATSDSVHTFYVTELVTLSTPNQYNYYIKCRDFNNNLMEDDTVYSLIVEGDAVPPSAVDDLVASDCDSSSCLLTWTSQGDDAVVGTAASYDIRYSTANITSVNFASATQAQLEPTPLVSGTEQTFTVIGLKADSTYYFAIKSIDRVGSTSDISNVDNEPTTAGSAASTTINAWNSPVTENIRPHETPTHSTTTATPKYAKGEYAAIQIGIIATTEAMANLDVNVTGVGDFEKTIYYESPMNIVTPSMDGGDTGEYPEILFPKIDSFFGETRNTFPMTVSNISRAYPMMKSNPNHNYCTGNDGKYYGNKVPASGYTYPYTCSSIDQGGNTQNWNVGVGTVDTVQSSTYLGDEYRRYIIELESTGEVGTATFKWSDDNGVTFQTGVPTTTDTVELNNGVGISFRGATGTDFTDGDQWLFYVNDTRNYMMWVDVYIPTTATAGTYTGTVDISADDRTTKSIPVTLTVYDFAIPETSSLPNFYAKAASTFSGAHGIAATTLINNAYVADGLRHRISLAENVYRSNAAVPGGTCTSYNEATDEITMSWNIDDVGGAGSEFINGSGVTVTPAGITFPGKLTSLRAHWLSLSDGTCTAVDSAKLLAAKRRALWAYAKAQGWDDILYTYHSDEPSATTFATVLNSTTAWEDADPEIPTLVTMDKKTFDNNLVYAYSSSTGTIPAWSSVTTDGGASTGTVKNQATATQQIVIQTLTGSFDSGDVVTNGTYNVTLSDSGTNLADHFDVLVPDTMATEIPQNAEGAEITCFMVGCGLDYGTLRSYYDTWLAESNPTPRKVWSYHACFDAGYCGFPGGTYGTGWTNFAIDSFDGAARYRQWFIRNFDYQGELYYATNYNFFRFDQRAVSPFESAYWFGVNGDGILFYPGRPDRIGGTTHIPLESFRLKQIRLGMQDYEYFKLLDDLGQTDYVQTETAKIVTTAKNFEQDPTVVDTVRAELAYMLGEGPQNIGGIGSGVNVQNVGNLGYITNVE